MNLSELAEEKLKKLQEEYDLSDLAANDRILLNNLAESMATLDTYNVLLVEALEAETVDLRRVKNLQDLITNATKNITSISDSLKIDRKNREKKTDSIPDYVQDLKQRAYKYIEQRFSYIYCPECKTLVATLWLLKYHQGAKLKFICPKCANSFIVSDSELDKRKNIDSVVVPKVQE